MEFFDLLTLFIIVVTLPFFSVPLFKGVMVLRLRFEEQERNWWDRVSGVPGVQLESNGVIGNLATVGGRRRRY